MFRRKRPAPAPQPDTRYQVRTRTATVYYTDDEHDAQLAARFHGGTVKDTYYDA